MANKVKTTQKITIEVGEQKMVLSETEAREVLAHLSEVFKVEVKVIKEDKPVYVPYYRQWPYYPNYPIAPTIWYSTTTKPQMLMNNDVSAGTTIKLNPNDFVKTTVTE